MAHFGPLNLVTDKCIALKIVFLLAINELKTVGDCQTLLVASYCIEFALGRVTFIHWRLGYVPKVPTNLPQSTFLQVFHHPPRVTAEQEKIHVLCPVRALEVNIHKTSCWRKSEQMLVCFGPPKRGCPITKQTKSRWIVEAISMAYEVLCQPSPL